MDLIAFITWANDNQLELKIVAVISALWTIASVYVSLTPNKKDDEALSRFRVEVLERLAYLAPRDLPGIFSLPGKKPRQ